MKTETKLCVDCKHSRLMCVSDNPEDYECLNPILPAERSLITGMRTSSKVWLCINLRKTFGMCGSKGKLWESK